MAESTEERASPTSLSHLSVFSLQSPLSLSLLLSLSLSLSVSLSELVSQLWTSYTSAREASCATAIVDAQLTPPTSRDDDAEMQDAPPPTVHDIATPRRQIGGRCRKKVHHSKLQTNTSALPVVCVVSNSAMVKHACSSGATETLNAPPFMPTVSMEESVHDPELHPKQPLDQEAVEVAARQRDCVIRAAADTEVLQPLAQDLDQASTDAPADEQVDEEIMDFQWFDNISWDSVKDLRGATDVQPPPRFKFALQQAQHAILRAIMHHNPSSLASEPAWKALVLNSWLLLGRPAVNASESNCAHSLEARLDLFWASPGRSQKCTPNPSHGDQESLSYRPGTSRSCPGICVQPFPVRSW